MKRSGRLNPSKGFKPRTSTLKASGSLRRSSPMPRSGAKESKGSGLVPKRKPASNAATAVPKSLHDAIVARDEALCARCRTNTTDRPHSVHHRQPRGMGGSGQRRNTPANLIVLCGSATSPDGCHLFVESHRDWAKSHGFLVPRGLDPATRPVLRYGQTWLIPADGEWVPSDPPEDFEEQEAA
jgi:hypothetical protein